MERSTFEVENADEAAKILTFIDTPEIDELDPSKAQGHHVPFEADLKMLVRLKPVRQDPSGSVDGNAEALNSVELIHFKVLCMGQENDPGSVRFELTSDDDIFFHYVCK